MKNILRRANNNFIRGVFFLGVTATLLLTFPKMGLMNFIPALLSIPYFMLWIVSLYVKVKGPQMSYGLLDYLINKENYKE